MHVCYIHQHFATLKSSSGTRSFEFSKQLIDAGHQVSLITGVNELNQASFPDIRDELHKTDIDGIEVYCISGNKYKNSMGFYRRLRNFGEFAFRAKSCAVAIKPDIIYATSTPLTVGIPGMKASKRLEIPFVFEVRDLWPELLIALKALRNPIAKYFARRLEKKIYYAAQHIVALAPGMKEGICKTGFHPSRVSVIPNGCDLKLFRPTEESLNDPRFGTENEVRFVFAGAHGIANGLDAVLDAAKILKQRNVEGIRLVFIGAGGLRDQLIARSEADGTIKFISWVPNLQKQELANVLPKMDVGMMILKNLPEFYYGTSPNKFFDYISSGLPVLNNYPGWVADMIQANDCGIAVPPDDPISFADAIQQFASQKQRMVTMRSNARELAVREFDRRFLGNQFINVLESVHNGACDDLTLRPRLGLLNNDTETA